MFKELALIYGSLTNIACILIKPRKIPKDRMVGSVKVGIRIHTDINRPRSLFGKARSGQGLVIDKQSGVSRNIFLRIQFQKY